MFSRIRTLILVLIAAVAGAAAGRAFAQMRSRAEAGEDPTNIDLEQIRVRPQDVVPGVIAAFRVREAPWSWLHIPAWFAAFAVNFGAAALQGDLQRLRQMMEDGEFSGFGGFGARTSGSDRSNGDEGPVWAAEAPPVEVSSPPPVSGEPQPGQASAGSPGDEPSGFTPYRD